MPPRKTRSSVSSSASAEVKSSSSLPKRQKKSDTIMQEEGSAAVVAPVLFASSARISKQAMAATRLQRVWRSTFAHSLTKHFAVELLKPGVGTTIEYVKSIRYCNSIKPGYFSLTTIQILTNPPLSSTASRPSSSSCARSSPSPSSRSASSASTSCPRSAMARRLVRWRRSTSTCASSWPAS